MAGNTELVELVEENGVAWITLNRPDKLNSLNTDMLQTLQAHLSRVSTTESIRTTVITGAGRAFCAGQDLADVEGVDLGEVLEAHYNPLVRSIKGLNMPVIACVNGVAAGAGANLALSCDLVLAGSSAKFIQSFALLGLVPDAGGTWALPKLIGLPRAMGLCISAEPLSASKAEDWGLIWRCVDDDQLMQETTALATHLASQPTTGLAFTKQLLNGSNARTLDEQLDLERDFQRAACHTADYKEGLNAFLGKRKPEFTGK